MEAIRMFREQKGLTQAQLAEMVGVRQHHISRWENDAVEISRSSMEKLAAALGVMPWQIHYAQELIDRRDGVEQAVTEYAVAT